MRIVQVSSDYPPYIGGVATHVAGLSKALARLGHAVVVFNYRHEIGRDRDELACGGRLRVCRQYFNHTWSRRTALVPYLLLGVGRFRRLIADFRPDILHWHDMLEGAWLTRLAGGGRAAVVFTNHTSAFLRWRRHWFHRSLMRESFGHADLVIAPSDELYARSDILGARRLAIPNGVDTEVFAPPASASVKETCCRALGLNHGPVVICARRFVQKCGVQCLVEALPELVAAVPEATVLFVGSGPMEAELRARVAQLGVQSNVRFLGPISNDRMPDVYRAGDVAVFPSLVEAVSIAALEAMSTALPLVATRVGGLPQIVHDQETGLLVDAGEVEQLAGACIRLLRDSAWARQLGANARALARSQYDWLQIARRTVEAYESALAEHGGRKVPACA